MNLYYQPFWLNTTKGYVLAIEFAMQLFAKGWASVGWGSSSYMANLGNKIE
jgi:hypothetical protein